MKPTSPVRSSPPGSAAAADSAGGSRAHRRGRSSRPEEIAALDFCAFQLGTVRDYMEPPGSAELEKAYQRYVHEPDVNR